MFKENEKEARFTVATAILVGMAASGKISLKEVDKEAVKTSFAYADELMKQGEEHGTEVPETSA